MRRSRGASAVVLMCALTAGCSGFSDHGAIHPMSLMIPNAQGGGYDTTGRTLASVMERDSIVSHLNVFNVTGSNETVAMARLIKESGNDDLMMVMGLGMVGSCNASGAACRPTDATPIAELTEQPAIVVVPADSPYHSIGQLVAAWRKNPSAVTVGGGSSDGGPYYVFAQELAQHVGISSGALYTGYSGNGELLPALLDHRVTFGVAGVAEYRGQIGAGQLRVLAVSSARPDSRAVPTLQQTGIDLTFVNWHGLLAPPGISRNARNHLIELVTRAHGSALWKKALAVNGWTDAFRSGDGFTRFLEQQEADNARITRRLARLQVNTAA